MILNKMAMYFRLLFANQWKKPEVYSKYLKIKFGKNCRILHFPRWGSEPFLIQIGDDVTITRNVSFVNHDGGVAIFRKQHPGLNVYGLIIIGNNVFIGINSIILPNVTIGNNVVIGAGSIVNRNIPDNVVVAGAPARVIKTIDEYKENIMKKGCIILSGDSKKRREIIENYINKQMNINQTGIADL